MELTIAMCKAAFNELGERRIADVYEDKDTCAVDYALKRAGVPLPLASTSGYLGSDGQIRPMPEWGATFIEAFDSKFSGSEWGRATGTEMLVMLDAVLRAPQ